MLLEVRALLVQPDCPVQLVPLAVREIRGRLGHRAQPVQPASRGQSELPERPAIPDQRVQQVRQERREQAAEPVLPEPRVPPEYREIPDILEHLVGAGQPEQQDQLAVQVRQVLLVRSEPLVIPAQLALPDLQGSRAIRDRPDRLELPD